MSFVASVDMTSPRPRPVTATVTKLPGMEPVTSTPIRRASLSSGEWFYQTAKKFGIFLFPDKGNFFGNSLPVIYTNSERTP